MFLVISYCADIFHDDDINCQFEVSMDLKSLVDKYGDPTPNHNLIEFESGADVFDLNYFKIHDGEFNLVDTYLTPETVNKILDAEAETKAKAEEKKKQNDSDDVDDSEQQQKQTLEEIVTDINEFKKKIYDLSPHRDEVREPTDIVINENIDEKIRRKKLRQFIKMKKGLRIRYDNLVSTGQYYYISLHFDKGMTSNFPRSDDCSKVVSIGGDQLYYGCKPLRDWTSMEYELFYHPTAHFHIHKQTEDMVQYIDKTIGANRSKYDNANIFFSKFNMNKEFVYNLNPNSEVWLESATHKTETSPVRLTNNRFYNEPMTFVSEEKTDDMLIHRYKNCQPITEYGHNIYVEQFIPLERVDRSIEYYNAENSKECTLDKILKTHYKYNLIHERMDE